MELQYILTRNQAVQKTKRIAFEIFEKHVGEQEIVLVGIYDKGYLWAKLLQKELILYFSGKVRLLKLEVDKNSPTQSEIKIDGESKELENKSIILIDDVLNSGRTLAYSIKPFLSIPIIGLEIAVLVDRGHKKFPVSADYIGYSLSTTLKEHIDVVFDDLGISHAVLH